MLADIYAQMLDEFGDTFEQTSESDSQKDADGRSAFLTSSQKRAVNFDKFKDSIVRKHRPKSKPRSCDALYRHSENEWFLIEFKNGKVEQKDISEIKEKIFGSLLLLTEKLDKTIGFTREKLTFILVYNEDKNRDIEARREVGKSMYKLANARFFPFGFDDFKKIYFKKVYEWNKKEFDSDFVRKYLASGS
jgi:hypothetical protein